MAMHKNQPLIEPKEKMKNYQQTPKQKRLAFSNQKAKFNASIKAPKEPLANFKKASGLWPWQRIATGQWLN